MIKNLKTGESIRMHRKESGLTQENLAELLGVSVPTISHWENGIKVDRIPINIFTEMTDIFDCEFDKSF